MADYPWTLKTSALEDFLKKMSTRPEPARVTQEFLKSLGYTSSNDWQTIPILKFSKFLDANGNPTEFYRNFRDTSKAKAVMAQAIRESYSELFLAHAAPWQASDVDLENFFRTKTGRGERMLRATVGTFKELCQFADFGAAPIQMQPSLQQANATVTTLSTASAQPPTIHLPITREGGVNLNVDIRLELPATQDASVYDKIFESLKKHLLNPNSKAD
ncbi:MAG: DUF5343 domain-containing protein [Candidatus Bathyarchaeia archaeon]